MTRPIVRQRLHSHSGNGHGNSCRSGGTRAIFLGFDRNIAARRRGPGFFAGTERQRLPQGSIIQWRGRGEVRQNPLTLSSAIPLEIHNNIYTERNKDGSENHRRRDVPFCLRRSSAHTHKHTHTLSRSSYPSVSEFTSALFSARAAGESRNPAEHEFNQCFCMRNVRGK